MKNVGSSAHILPKLTFGVDCSWKFRQCLPVLELISLPHWKWTPTPYEEVLPKSFSSKVKQHANRVVIKHWGVRRRIWGIYWWMCSGFVCQQNSLWPSVFPPVWVQLLLITPQNSSVHLFLLKHTLILDSTFWFHFLLPPFIQKNTGILHEIFLIWLDW